MNSIDRLRQYLVKASFSSSSDRHSALECLDEIVRNAQRYMWLREQHWSDETAVVVSNKNDNMPPGLYCYSKSDLDELIDKDMQP